MRKDERQMRLSRDISMIKLSEEQLRQMTRYCEHERDILALYLYGSYGTSHQTRLSDVDLAVLPMPGARWDIHRELEIHAELARIGGSEDINLVNLRTVPVTLQLRVLETGRVLYRRDREMVADFVEAVIVRHADFLPDLQAFHADYDLGLREEFL